MPGRYTTFKYEGDETGAIYAVRLQPESLTGEANTEPAGAVTRKVTPFSPMSRSRKKGVHMRHMVISATIGTGVGPYTGASLSVRLPILTRAAFATIAKGDLVTYAGRADWQVVNTVPEVIR